MAAQRYFLTVDLSSSRVKDVHIGHSVISVLIFQFQLKFLLAIRSLFVYPPLVERIGEVFILLYVFLPAIR